jgi:hypothetical protein
LGNDVEFRFFTRQSQFFSAVRGRLLFKGGPRNWFSCWKTWHSWRSNADKIVIYEYSNVRTKIITSVAICIKNNVSGLTSIFVNLEKGWRHTPDCDEDVFLDDLYRSISHEYVHSAMNDIVGSSVFPGDELVLEWMGL